MNANNRSTLYHYFHYDTPLELRFIKRGKGRYKVFKIPDEWEGHSYLLINDVRIKDFQAVIIYTNELVVRFGKTLDCQINIPYKVIKYIEVLDSMMIPYEGVHLCNEKNNHDM